MKYTARAVPLCLALLLSSGCFNMPTPTAQITGSYVSTTRFEKFTDEELAAELDSLSRRETQLVVAQEQRRKSSEVQAFWTGYGQGDGLEAAELAQVRGEKEAVRKVIEVRKARAGAAIPAAMGK